MAVLENPRPAVAGSQARLEVVVRRVGGPLVLALVVAGCGWWPMADARAPLLTGWGPFVGGGACYTFGVAGPLRFDPEFGTTITPDRGQQVPVMWPPGYTARWVGSEVEVQDASGGTVALTGASYDIEGGYWSEAITPTASNHYSFSGPRVFLACGSVLPRP